MQFITLTTDRASADVISGILNGVCPECAEKWVARARSSSARASVRKIGVRFGSEPFRPDSIGAPTGDHLQSWVRA